jgi:hypothetical protein
MCDFKKAATILVLCVGVSSPVSAQQVTPGQSEVVGFIGGVTDGGGFTFGGGVHYALDPKWIVVGELSYLTGGDDFNGSFQGIGVSAESSAIAVDLNAHYLFQRPGKAPFAPYVLGGLGIVRARGTATILGVTQSVSDTEAGVNIGVGGRWQPGVNWGVRPELKVLIAENTSARFSVGLYYQFGR